jgi:ketosteroid isomerase-like protein
MLSPGVHITQCPQLPFGGTFLGHEGARVFFGKVATYLDSYVTIERIIDTGEHVALIGRTYGTVKSTGRKFEIPIMHLWGFKDGLAVRLEIALDVPTMLAALDS